MFRSYSSVDFGTKPGEKKHFKQKRFHPEGEATSRPVKTSARPFLSGRRTLGVCILCKKESGVGEAVHTYVLLSLPPHKKERKVGAKDFTHVCEFSSFPTKRREEEDRTFLGGCT